jgi:hypothetical protein
VIPLDGRMLRIAMYVLASEAIVQHEVGYRPGRYEPRANERQAKPQHFLMELRCEARKR